MTKKAHSDGHPDPQVVHCDQTRHLSSDSAHDGYRTAASRKKEEIDIFSSTVYLQDYEIAFRHSPCIDNEKHPANREPHLKLHI